MAKILALVSGKGGVGKSTLAVCLAAEWRARGLRVLVVDADPQGSAVTWADVAAEAGHAAPPVTALGDTLRQAVPELARGFDLVVLDTPGRASKRLPGALVLADVALVPCGPSAVDVWALAGLLEVVREVRELRPGLAVALVANRAKSTTLARSARDALDQCGEPVLGTVIGDRTAYGEAVACGQGVTAYAPRSAAALEMRALADEVGALLGIGKDAANVA